MPQLRSKMATAYAVVEMLSTLGNMLPGMRAYGLILSAPGELIDAMRNCGHPDSLLVVELLERRDSTSSQSEND